ncbi:MAG: hypothetical protein JNG53_05380 [Senegalimassilia sp.]|nr:hypothetical protein [Senegalimassilia sp.]
MKTAEQKVEQMSRILEKTARDAAGYLNNVPHTTKFRHDAYYRVLDKRQRARAAVASKPAVAVATAKSFVNAYGEATQREISCASYRAAQRRLEKSVLRNLGI